ncbi:COG2731 Beta-galactosidase [Vibrio sp. B1REV9]|uniref:YhcH/YjgK/YiaL family protein n=1 Tax=Vibrio sp. B1REV9 TaxID=2751179 RepID=UPI001AF70117|nr:YhcH/YjgK/YiaL family protein [Vibrio sp. B1REV9]CAE6901271.1 COG2731 Beta-galactosidase [Vibrio sp. B1REV9]
MIKGNLSNVSNCPELPHKLLEVINVVKAQLNNTIENGRYSIKGEDVFFFVVDDHTQSLQERKSECHRKYVDVQILLSGEERFGYSLESFGSIAEDNFESNDVAFSEDIIDEKFVDLQPLDFVVFTVQQPHRPLVAINQAMAVRKAIIKVSNDWLAA